MSTKNIDYWFLLTAYKFKIGLVLDWTLSNNPEEIITHITEIETTAKQVIEIYSFTEYVFMDCNPP